jgi:REP element-mobilizing transposase RayT
MAPKPRPVHAGLYHVASGATKPDPFFRDNVDRGIFVVELARMLALEDVVCIGFCLLTTHYHAIFDAVEGALPSAMQRLNWHYARQSNRRHERLGHAVGRRYMAEPIADDEHLLNAFRYVALNPVDAGECTRPQDSRWSSYASAIGLRRDYSFVDPPASSDASHERARRRSSASEASSRRLPRRQLSQLGKCPLRDGRLEQLARDERARAGAESWARPRARTDVEQPPHRRRVTGVARERPPQEVLVERERSAVRVAVPQVDVRLLEIVRTERDTFHDR